MEGNFRRTCCSVMRVLRENKDSVMAVLEAFVYDPLLNWRLIDGEHSLHHTLETSHMPHVPTQTMLRQRGRRTINVFRKSLQVTMVM